MRSRLCVELACRQRAPLNCNRQQLSSCVVAATPGALCNRPQQAQAFGAFRCRWQCETKQRSWFASQGAHVPVHVQL